MIRDVVLEWVGAEQGVECIITIPARGLDHDEAQRFGRAYLLSTNLYTPKQGSKPEKDNDDGED